MKFKWEQEMLKRITEKVWLLRDLKEGKDTDTADGYSHNFVLEMKKRCKWYPDTMLERKKLKDLLSISQGRDVIYAVTTEGDDKIYLFNISVLLEQGWRPEWKTEECPSTSHFQNKSKKNKTVCYLDWDQAHEVI